MEVAWWPGRAFGAGQGVLEGLEPWKKGSSFFLVCVCVAINFALNLAVARHSFFLSMISMIYSIHI